MIPFFLDLCAFFRKRFFAVFDGLWAVEMWAIHRLTAVLLHLQIVLGESNGFSGPVQSHLNSDAVIAREGRPYRFRQHHEILSQFDDSSISNQLSAAQMTAHTFNTSISRI